MGGAKKFYMLFMVVRFLFGTGWMQKKDPLWEIRAGDQIRSHFPGGFILSLIFFEVVCPLRGGDAKAHIVPVLLVRFSTWLVIYWHKKEKKLLILFSEMNIKTKESK